MAFRRPLVIVSGSFSQLPIGDDIDGVAYAADVIGSGLYYDEATTEVGVALAPNPSGLIFVGGGGATSSLLSLDGSAVASGTAAIEVADTALASGNAAISLALSAQADAAEALASGNAGIQIALTAEDLAAEALASGNAGISLALGAQATADSALASGNAGLTIVNGINTDNLPYQLQVDDGGGITEANLILASGSLEQAASTITFSGVGGIFVQKGAGSTFTISGTSPAGGGGVPTGGIAWFGDNTAPAGFLECDGSAVSRTTQSALFGVVGTTFGAGDGSTTFNIPDLRGVFIRGWDNGRGVDTGRTFGTAQDDSIPDHTHFWRAEGGSDGQNMGKSDPDGNAPGNDGGYNRGVIGISPSTLQGVTDVATEARPRNLALLPMIKT